MGGEECLADYETLNEVATRLPRFVEEAYNAKRLHAALGYRSLNEFEPQLAREAAWFRCAWWSSSRVSPQ